LSTPGRTGELFGASHEIAFVPSASVAAALSARATSRSVGSPRIAVFADPVFAVDDPRVPVKSQRASGADSAWPRLRFSAQEADSIARVAAKRATVWTDFAASRGTALRSPLSDYGVIHLATHAVIDEERPQLSGVLLSQVDREGRSQEGLLRVHEIYNLSLNARLVVLSACRTALGRQVEGEGLIGLARAFLHAGSNAVLATLWDVDDRATAAFMTRFYDELITHRQSPSAALRAAALAQQKDPKWSATRDWAGFVLIGYSE
jgi:CHAT domain-containing protein